MRVAEIIDATEPSAEAPPLSTVTAKLPDLLSPFSVQLALNCIGVPTREAGTVTVCWNVIDSPAGIVTPSVPEKKRLLPCVMAIFSIAY